eukprot:PhF_6_TR41551/c0_g1_i1/m.62938/K04712/DEGS; sphingolipid 4-desaturase/C4-monooxygenase
MSYLWSQEPEPHAAIKKNLLARHGPEINKLMGPEPLTKFIVVAVVLIQVFCGCIIAPSLSFWNFFLLAYVIGSTCTHNLFLAIHEISHNLAFKSVALNHCLGFIANLPIVFPYSVSFRQYHLEHHRYQGTEGVDSDLPTEFESKLLDSRLGKIFFVTFQILFYALRPVCVKRQPFTVSHATNLVIQIVFVSLVVAFFGTDPIKYFVLSTFLAGSWTPMAGHFLSEHYVMYPNTMQETFSYYGPLNILGYNVGYHNEHHDFPNVPWSRLPALRRVASEHYDSLLQTPSWPGALLQFVMDDHVSLWSRVK